MQTGRTSTSYPQQQPDMPLYNSYITRRSFLQSLTAGAALPLVLGGCRTTDGIRNAYGRARRGSYLSGLKVETRLSDADAFTEGPAVDRSGDVYFTNIPASRILRWNPRSSELSVFREDSNMANGLLFEGRGRLLVCEGLSGRLIRIDMETGETEILAETFEGRPLAPPNDVALDSSGRIYFSSRPSGEVPPRPNVTPNAVYRLDPDGSLHRLLGEPEVDMPNGLVVSNDDATLYLIEAHSGEGSSRHIKAFDLAANGSISNGRILIDFYPGRSGDGMCIDVEDNLYVAAGLHERRGTSETLDTQPGIHVISPDGELLDYLKTPVDTVTNCTFGGEDLRTLYVTAGPLLLSARTNIPGHPRYRPGG